MCTRSPCGAECEPHLRNSIWKSQHVVWYVGVRTALRSDYIYKHNANNNNVCDFLHLKQLHSELNVFFTEGFTTAPGRQTLAAIMS